MSDFNAGIQAAKAAIDFVEQRVNFSNSAELCQRLKAIDGQHFDVLALVRGGGGGIENLDDLDVLQTVADLQTPLIAAIGHVEEKLFIKQIADKEADNVYKVKTFTEKPELELAKVFVASGEFYWNSGLFMWNVNSIIKAFETHLPAVAKNLKSDTYGTPQEMEFINKNFPACTNVSIDFGVMDKADNVYVSLGDFGWSDLGTCLPAVHPPRPGLGGGQRNVYGG